MNNHAAKLAISGLEFVFNRCRILDFLIFLLFLMAFIFNRIVKTVTMMPPFSSVTLRFSFWAEPSAATVVEFFRGYNGADLSEREGKREGKSISNQPSHRNIKRNRAACTFVEFFASLIFGYIICGADASTRVYLSISPEPTESRPFPPLEVFHRRSFIGQDRNENFSDAVVWPCPLHRAFPSQMAARCNAFRRCNKHFHLPLNFSLYLCFLFISNVYIVPRDAKVHPLKGDFGGHILPLEKFN